MPKERIAYIDFLKGLCMIIIVIGHIEENFFDFLLPNLKFAMSNKVPMFFFLSGLFFNSYSGFNEFMRKKVNNLIVTLFFFHFLCCLLKLPLFVYATFINPNPDVDIHFSMTDIIPPVFGRYWRSAGALWFLVALFEMNIIYYLFIKYLNRIGVAIAIVLSSIAGYMLMKYQIELPCVLDIALVGLPYFMLGSVVKHFNLLAPSRYDKLGFLVMIPCLFLIYYCSADIDFLYQKIPNYFKLYAIPFIAMLSLFWCSKNLRYVPLICYYGRYSIILLGTHQVLITYLWFALWTYCSNFGWRNLIILTFVIVMFLEFFIIKLMIKYFPRFTAQKEFFLPGWRISHE